mmetsp:Transcript_11933/g.24303  ORF Transcript_11933/g.24303 Transcript_11933/m.24303 type:complete len:99 (+) Transcript_11933:1456-1752(+)
MNGSLQRGQSQLSLSWSVAYNSLWIQWMIPSVWTDSWRKQRKGGWSNPRPHSDQGISSILTSEAKARTTPTGEYARGGRQMIMSVGQEKGTAPVVARY